MADAHFSRDPELQFVFPFEFGVDTIAMASPLFL
jgi:hypothetical protein